MKTEFEVSIRIACWGDSLDPFHLADILGLNPSFCKLKCKGDELRRGDGSQTGSFAKTGLLRYTYVSEFPESRRDPETQFKFLTNRLKKLTNSLCDKYKVEAAEVQIFLYYENKLPGDVEFLIPEMLLKELCRHRIQVRVTVLP